MACIVLIGISFGACNDDDNNKNSSENLSEEWYAGGKLGTVFDATSSAFEQSTPVVDEDPTMYASFLRGEGFFEDVFIEGTDHGARRQGLGPVFVRNSCITCHPGYGHGKRMERYNANDFGNGYLLVVYDKDTEAYVPELTGMPQTRAVSPYLPPIDEKGINLVWKNHTDEYGNKFPDGETYSLIYPEVTIDPNYINTDPKPTNYEVRLEATIGIYGTGLLDAIPDEDIIAEYNRQKAKGYYELNDAIYTNPAMLITENDGSKRLRKFTYALSRATIQNGPGSNAIWNITNVTRPGRQYNYITNAYARAMSKNTDIQASLGKTEAEIYEDLRNKGGELENQTLPIEFSKQEYIDLMIWHRGLAVPAARDVDDATVKKGKELFKQIGCAECHKPSWKTGADEYTGDMLLVGKLPRYPHQTIYPYTDMLQHRLEMVNNIRTGWCRTTPLWGRGLSELCTGAGEHLHDMRARNYTEAIMWHGGDAKITKEKYRNLSKEDRDSLIKFLKSI